MSHLFDFTVTGAPLPPPPPPSLWGLCPPPPPSLTPPPSGLCGLHVCGRMSDSGMGGWIHSLSTETCGHVRWFDGMTVRRYDDQPPNQLCLVFLRNWLK